MKRVIGITLLISILSMFAGYSCSNTNEVFENKEYVTVKINETVIVPSINNKMEITFKDVKDARCPGKSAEVCYPNLAHIFLSMKYNNLNVDITLMIGGILDEFGRGYTYPVDTLGYRFIFSNLTPIPIGLLGATGINKDDYLAKIKISKL